MSEQTLCAIILQKKKKKNSNNLDFFLQYAAPLSCALVYKSVFEKVRIFSVTYVTKMSL